jgi:ECF transporter S component (folate family)
MKTTKRDLTLFRTPLTPSYWRLAFGECRSLKMITLTAILVAICGILDIFFIPIVNANVLQIKFSFFAIALCAMVCGPVLAIPAGFLIDTIGFLLGGNLAGGYFFGYAISSICSCVIFALFFYRAKRITVLRTALAKLAVEKSAVMWGDNEDIYWCLGHLDPDGGIGPLTVNRLAQILTSGDKGVYLTVFVLALLGLFSLLREGCRERGSLLLCFLFCGYYGVHLIMEVQSRYRYFLMPAIFLLAGHGLCVLTGLRRRT